MPSSRSSTNFWPLPTDPRVSAAKPIRDLQRRLGTAGFPPVGAEAGFLLRGHRRRCVLDFQRAARSACQSGDVATRRTWRAIVEASWKLGDRLLMLVAPEPARRRCRRTPIVVGAHRFRLGSRRRHLRAGHRPRAGRLPAQQRGQRGRRVWHRRPFGRSSVLARQTGTGPGHHRVARARGVLTATARSLSDLRIVVGQFGGLSSLSRQLVQALRQRSATVVASDEPDAGVQAATANRFAATVYIGFESQAGHGLDDPLLRGAAVRIGGRSCSWRHGSHHCCTERVADLETAQVRGHAPDRCCEKPGCRQCCSRSVTIQVRRSTTLRRSFDAVVEAVSRTMGRENQCYPQVELRQRRTHPRYRRFIHRILPTL